MREGVACPSCPGCVSLEGDSMAMLSTKMLMEAINVNFAVEQFFSPTGVVP
jgi:hypothetical protein